jgi:CTP synthase (UTP-ammonia lyase)
VVEEGAQRLSRNPTIALLGEDRGHRSHQELNALRPQLAELGVETVWVPSDSSFSIEEYDGVWLVPGSPYADDDAVFRALTVVRERGIPFLGSCGGMQDAVLEFVKSVLGESATHAESDGEGDDNVVTALACSLYGEERLVTPVAGTRFGGWVDAPFTGMHFCNYAPTVEVVDRLVTAGVVVGATADDAGAEVLEFPDHPFYVVSMFQPHIGALAGAPVHPLVLAFAEAAREASARA